MSSFRGGFGGFGGGGANMQQLMKQAQAMERQMKEKQEQLANEEVTATSGGGMVTVVMTGKKKLISVKIKKEAVDPDDIEMLEDLVTAAISEAMNKADELSKEYLGGMGGLF